MIRSMTGFGQSGRSARGYSVRAEVKSVNHRYSEIAVRIPREWLSLEDGVKREIAHAVKRGKVDALVTIDREDGGAKSLEIDWAAAQSYMEAAEQLKRRFGLSDSLTLRDLMTLPGVIEHREVVHDPEQLREPILECVRDAVRAMLRMRETEGEHLARYMSERLNRLEQLHREVGRSAEQTAEEYRAKLHEKLAELLGVAAALGRDDPRLMTEAALLAEKSDIGEELSRLSSHFGQCRKLLASDEPIGRKLDFLIQEMNREINTIGSKSNRLEFTECVVEMKAELEKMREQAQNIE